jgi:predicted Zn-dependent protease
MSEQLLQQLGAAALDLALQKKSEETRALWSQVYGVGSQVGVMLPHSRTQESEADHLGLIFMAIAGYNPSLAVPFWQRMSQQSSGAKPPEFLSTHPSDETRISQIQQMLPEALKYYTKK